MKYPSRRHYLGQKFYHDIARRVGDIHAKRICKLVGLYVRLFNLIGKWFPDPPRG